MWKKARRRLKESAAIRAALAFATTGWLRLVHRTNPLVPGSIVPREVMTGEPVIIALWHGRHFMVPLLSPPGVPVTALISRSSDAELNAAVLQRLGVETVRGSGGGERARADKGGIGAFKGLLRALASGRTVVMIADPQGQARRAGEGIVRLAKASGAPIVPVAYASSRARVFERAWDKAAMNLPFGRSAVIAGARITVPREADAEAIERARQLLTVELDRATSRAGHLAGARHDIAVDPALGTDAGLARHGGAP